MGSNEVCEKYIVRMRQAMEVSFHKYGPVRKAFPHKVDAVKNIESRLKLYKESGNADYLVDVGNFAMIEFMLPAHAKAHDTPTDGGEGRKWHGTKPPTEQKNDGTRF